MKKKWLTHETPVLDLGYLMMVVMPSKRVDPFEVLVSSISDLQPIHFLAGTAHTVTVNSLNETINQSINLAGSG